MPVCLPAYRITNLPFLPDSIKGVWRVRSCRRQYINAATFQTTERFESCVPVALACPLRFRVWYDPFSDNGDEDYQELIPGPVPEGYLCAPHTSDI